MGWILFLIGLWLIPVILCLVLMYFNWREERGDSKTVSALCEYCFDLLEQINHWPVFVPFVNMLMVIIFTLRYLYLLFKDKELW